jgi:EpsI family protein
MTWGRVAVSAILLVVLTVAFHSVSHGENIPDHRPLASFPLTIGLWQGQNVIIDSRLVEGLKADDMLTRTYESANDAPLALYIAYFNSQRQGQTIHSPKNCLPGSGWTAVESRRETMDVGAGEKVNLNRYIVQNGIERQLVLYWYQSHGRMIASEYVAKMDLVLDAIQLNRTDGALVRVSIPIEDDPAATEQVARGFVGQIYGLLPEYIPQ